MRATYRPATSSQSGAKAILIIFFNHFLFRFKTNNSKQKVTFESKCRPHMLEFETTVFKTDLEEPNCLSQIELY